MIRILTNTDINTSDRRYNLSINPLSLLHVGVKLSTIFTYMNHTNVFKGI